MPRPCIKKHPPSPAKCPYCALLDLGGPATEAALKLWGPDDDTTYPADAYMVAGDELLAFAGDELLDDVDYRRVPGRYRPGDLLPGLVDPIAQLDGLRRNAGWERTEEARAQHIAGLSRLLSADLVPPERTGGDGIVYVGGGRYWPMVCIGVRMARQFTDLPIQVWHGGRGEPVNMDDLADVRNIEVRSVDDLGYPMRRNGGWENKTTAIIHSGFSRVVYLDADAYLVSDPAPLFDAAGRNRFAFWADLPWNNETVKWDWYGVQNEARVPPIQGGQLGMDVVSFWREIVISHWINQHSPYFYAHQYGDQDSWRIALAATKGQHEVLGAAGWQPPAFVCRYPDPLVVHRCQAKLWGDTQVKFAHDLPAEDKVRSLYNDQVIGRGKPAEVFGRIYKIGMWGAEDSSGAGGSPAEAEPYLVLIKTILRLSGWCSVVDLGCGDGRVTIGLQAEKVHGVDVHAPHIARLAAGNPRIEWSALDLDQERDLLPSGDVCLMKDVLHHWPSALIRDWLPWAKKCGKWKAVVFAHDCHQQKDDADCILGGYRALNPSMLPLSGLDLEPVAQYLHKQVVILYCG